LRTFLVWRIEPGRTQRGLHDLADDSINGTPRRH
jgi:hypothetical protein